jgi:hypothetical protein
MKLYIIIAVLSFMAASSYFCNIRMFIYITVVSIFFPIFIPFMGRDAMSTGTACIVLLYLKYLAQCLKENRFLEEKFDLCIYSLIILSAFAIAFPIVTGALQGMLIGRAVRNFCAFSSAILLFTVIKNYKDDSLKTNSGSRADHIEKLLSLLLLLISVHILISICLKIFPNIAPVFNIFYERNVSDVLEFSKGQTFDIERAWTFVMTPESYGEILAVLSPIVVYKMFRFRTSIWFSCLLLFGCGQILSVTRSGILLFVFAVNFSLLYHLKKKFAKTIACSFFLLTVLSVIIIYHPSLFENVIFRFGEAAQTYKQSGNFLSTINRSGVFEPAYLLTMSKLSLFGNGLTPFHFHNLFFTTLHEKGIVGAVFFFVVLLYPAVHLIKDLMTTTDNKVLILSCLLSIVIFLINETKFEFTRQASYQQICWAVLGTYCLVSKVSSPKN